MLFMTVQRKRFLYLLLYFIYLPTADDALTAFLNYYSNISQHHHIQFLDGIHRKTNTFRTIPSADQLILIPAISSEIFGTPTLMVDALCL